MSWIVTKYLLTAEVVVLVSELCKRYHGGIGSIVDSRTLNVQNRGFRRKIAHRNPPLRLRFAQEKIIICCFKWILKSWPAS